MDGYRKGDRVCYRRRTWEVCWAGDGGLLLRDTVTGERTLAAAADAALLWRAGRKPSGRLPSGEPDRQRRTGGDAGIRPVQAFDQGGPVPAHTAGLPEPGGADFPECRELEIFDAERLDVWVVAPGGAAYQWLQSVVIDRATRTIMGFALGPETHLV